MKRISVLLMAVLLSVGACGGSSDDNGDSSSGAEKPADSGAGATTQIVAVTARDYAFDMPATIKGGLVRFDMVNQGKEPHFVGIIKPVTGIPISQVKSALQSQQTPIPPPGPTPYEDVAGVSMSDGGRPGNATYRLKPGKYLVMCSIPTADGVPHFAKGMLNELTVTEGDVAAPPKADATITGTDMALTPVPPLTAGKHTIAFKNDGKQLHEINLVELNAGKTVTDVVAWFRDRSSPPVTTSLGGVAVAPGETGYTEVDLRAGARYAFVCAVDDVLGDHSPHIVEGMVTAEFSPSG